MQRDLFLELSGHQVDFREIDVFPQAWTTQRGFARYWELPRPSNALFLICRELRVTFHSQDGASLTAGKGDVVLIPQGSRYRVTVEGDADGGIDTYTVNFRMLDETGQPILPGDGIRILTNRRDDTLVLRARRLGDVAHFAQRDSSPEGRNEWKIKMEFYTLLDALADAASAHEDLYYPIRVGADALRNEWNRNERIETYAAMCGISNAYFYQCFRRWCGKSPVEYRNALRLSNAEAMLRNTEMRIREIAEVVGFEDPFYFCRVFARQYGVSPQQYRKARRARSETGEGKA